MLERIMEGNKALVQIRSGRSPKIGTVITLDSYKVECTDRQDNFFILQFDRPPLEIFNSIGHVPLPPYIKRPDEELDKDRYATVYEDKTLQESVAAPTAGLHFDKELLNAITKMGVKVATVNLSVGAGTFQPVKVDNIEDHNIHSEYLEVSPDVVDMVIATKKAGKKVFSVGTTAARALETAFMDKNEKGYKGYTKLFIYPGYKFKAVDMLITNFHLPQSSLLMLVSAFIGYDNMKDIYKTAVEEKYRFLSYGDAMLLEKYEI
jgi:S-adenosylmethionine:tRNA ribosyltransferase-isomerase